MKDKPYSHYRADIFAVLLNEKLAEQRIKEFQCSFSDAVIEKLTESELNGAISIFYKGALRTISEHYYEDFFVIPNSVHEVLIYPISALIDMDISRLEKSIVRNNEVNGPYSALSSCLLFYNHATEELENASVHNAEFYKQITNKKEQIYQFVNDRQKALS